MPEGQVSPDFIFWDPSWGTYGWDRSSYRGDNDFGYYALRIGSEIWKANMRAAKQTAYKQLEGEFIRQGVELAAARNRIVDLERERNGLAVELNSAKDEAARQFNKVQNLERRLIAEAEEAAQRIISLEDECGRLHELWHEAQVKVDNSIDWKGHHDSLRRQADHKITELESRLNAATQKYAVMELNLFAYGDLVSKLAKVLGISVMEISLNEVLERVQELVGKVDAARRESTNFILMSRIEEVVRERDGWQETAAQHLRNEQFYRDLLGQCAELLGDECRRSDDGKLIPKGDFLALKVPEVLKERLENGKDIREEFNKHVTLGHELFGPRGAFSGALTVGQDMVLDGMRWMCYEIQLLRKNNNSRLRERVATELGKATNNILKGL